MWYCHGVIYIKPVVEFFIIHLYDAASLLRKSKQRQTCNCKSTLVFEFLLLLFRWFLDMDTNSDCLWKYQIVY